MYGAARISEAELLTAHCEKCAVVSALALNMSLYAWRFFNELDEAQL